MVKYLGPTANEILYLNPKTLKKTQIVWKIPRNEFRKQYFFMSCMVQLIATLIRSYS